MVTGGGSGGGRCAKPRAAQPYTCNALTLAPSSVRQALAASIVLRVLQLREPLLAVPVGQSETPWKGAPKREPGRVGVKMGQAASCIGPTFASVTFASSRGTSHRS